MLAEREEGGQQQGAGYQSERQAKEYAKVHRRELSEFLCDDYTAGPEAARRYLACMARPRASASEMTFVDFGAGIAGSFR
jgi:hypothetical protein